MKLRPFMETPLWFEFMPSTGYHVVDEPLLGSEHSKILKHSMRSLCKFSRTFWVPLALIDWRKNRWIINGYRKLFSFQTITGRNRSLQVVQYVLLEVCVVMARLISKMFVETKVRYKLYLPKIISRYIIIKIYEAIPCRYRCILGNEQVLSWTKIRVLKNHYSIEMKKSRPLKGFSVSTHQLDIKHLPFRVYR